MTDAPERIWADYGVGNWTTSREKPPGSSRNITEYVRADLLAATLRREAETTKRYDDLHAALQAQLAEAKRLLAECAADLASHADHEYPEPSRSTYPSMKRRYERDMELVYRVRTTLAKLEKYK